VAASASVSSPGPRYTHSHKILTDEHSNIFLSYLANVTQKLCHFVHRYYCTYAILAKCI